MQKQQRPTSYADSIRSKIPGPSNQSPSSLKKTPVSSFTTFTQQNHQSQNQDRNATLNTLIETTSKRI